MAKKKKNDKFYNFSFNDKNNETDFYLYGEIISGGNDWKWDETDVTFQDVRDTLNGMEDNSTLNIYINSPGGSVFTTQSMVSMLDRAKDRGICINAYIDGMGASCASWLPMVADNLYIYQGSVLMIHKPMTSCWSANADDMREQIEFLDKIENEMIIPLYMSRAKEGITEDDIKDYMAKETWFTSNEILEVFDNVTLLESKKEVACCVDENVMKNYINIPENIKNLLEEQDSVSENDETENIDNTDSDPDTSGEEEKGVEPDVEHESEPEQKDEDGGESNDENVDPDNEEEEENLQKKLNSSNEKIIILNDKIKDLEDKIKTLEEVSEKYNAIQEENAKKELENKIEEKSKFYKAKFEKVGALDKFNSNEVQSLIKDCVSNSESLLKLNEMLVDMIFIEDNVKIVKTNISEVGKEIKDLIPTEEEGLSSLFE